MSRRKPELLDALFSETRRTRDALERARGNDRTGYLRTQLMPCQARLEADPHRRVSVRSARRNGKSTGVLLIVTIRCLERPGSQWVVVGLTRPSVKRIYWSALKALNKQYELGIQFQHQELIARFPNGSEISFVGAENVSEIEKLRGGKYDGVVIDECKSFAASVFTELVHDVLEPALLDRNGQLFVIGTPGDVLDGPFYLATCEEPVLVGDPPADGEPDRRLLSNRPFGSTPDRPFVWSLHAWTLRDNVTRFPDPETGRTFTLWEAAQLRKANNGWGDDHPTWRREYLGHWVANDLKRVYRYRSHVHDYTPVRDRHLGIPCDAAKDPRVRWRTICGVDLGTRDGTAMVVWAWSPHKRDLWEVHSERRTADTGQRLTVTQIAEWYKDLERRFGPFDGPAPADTAGLATMVADTLAVEHGVYLDPAEKREKLDHIEVFNSDLDAGLIHIRRGSDLSEDLAEDRWNEKKLEKGRREEDPTVPNDVADAALYAFRWCDHRRSKPENKPVTLFTRDWYNQVAAEELAAAERRARDANTVSLDREWWS